MTQFGISAVGHACQNIWEKESLFYKIIDMIWPKISISVYLLWGCNHNAAEIYIKKVCEKIKSMITLQKSKWFYILETFVMKY